MNISVNMHENMTMQEIISGSLRDLKPVDSRKSFYGKATVCTMPDGSEVLFSYGSPVLHKDKAGNLFRILHMEDCSNTTARHVTAYAGINKKEFAALPYEARRYNKLSF